MKVLLLLILLSTTPAHAGWLSNLCAKHLVADDPYQFETAHIDWVLNEYVRLRTKDRWNNLQDHDRSIYMILQKELENRLSYGNPDHHERILEVLNN